MKHFNIAFTIPETKLTTVISLLSNEVSGLHITEVEATKRITRTVAPGSRSSPIWDFARAFVMRYKVGETFTTEDFEKALTSAGHKVTNASPTSTKLKREGYVMAVERGVFRRLK